MEGPLLQLTQIIAREEFEEPSLLTHQLAWRDLGE
jgi:hypothetical protein